MIDQLILYALGAGVGIDQDPTDPRVLQCTWEGALQALPTYAVIPVFETLLGLMNVPGMDFNPMMLLHGEQYTEILAPPLPLEAWRRRAYHETLDEHDGIPSHTSAPPRHRQRKAGKAHAQTVREAPRRAAGLIECAPPSLSPCWPPAARAASWRFRRRRSSPPRS
jgi:hypothetical protein